MPRYGPRSRVLCPYCLQRFHPSDCRIVYANPQPNMRAARPGELLEDKEAPTKWLPKLISRFRVEHLTGPEAAIGDPARECPSCQNRLPTNIELVENYIIALVGLRFSGKTHFIATSIDELRTGVAASLGIQMFPENQKIADLYQTRYYDTVYKKIIPPPNQPGQDYDPLIYVLKRPGQEDVNLIFYDVSGEDLATAPEMRNYGRYVFYADAFIVMEDPLAIQAIADHALPADRLPDDAFAAVSGKDVLTWLTPLYRTFHKRRKTIPIPTAITLSKSDVLSFANTRSKYTFFNDPPYKDQVHMPRLKQNDLTNVNGDVQNFLRGLEHHAGLNLLQWKTQFKNASYFAISATGRPVNVAGQAYAGDINPLRVLDPLLWVLWQLKVISAQ